MKEGIDMKAKWIIKSRHTTREECDDFCKKHRLDPKNFKDTEDFNGVEIFIVREDKEHDIKSYGPGNLNKIILFDDGDYNKKEMKWCEQVAKIICDALNREGL